LDIRLISSRIQHLLHRFDVDRAVFFGLSSRVWSFCAGPVTAILIATQFTPEIQGYYYTFATILALQLLVELGLGTVIVQFASHEWSKLSLDESGHIVGERDALSRLVSIAKFASKWYVVCGILIAAGLGIGGYLFFSTSARSNVDWIAPWFFLCFITGLTVSLVPIWSLLEGCNQVAQLYTFRFFQGVLTSISIWVAMLAGAELWTASISGIATLLASIFFLRRRYWAFVTTLLRSKPEGPGIQWRTEMLPMQWRIAISWISGYFIYFLFVPILFKYQGPLVAGQMGMTWSITGVLGAVSSAWVSPRAPQFGILIAQRRYAELDRQLWKITKIVTGTSVLLALMIWSFVFMLNTLDSAVAERFASRILPPLPTGLFLLAQLIYASVSPTSVYLRAHKKEPLMAFSVVYAVLVGSSTFFLGRYYSATGMALGYLVLNIVCMPIAVLVWYRCRKQWHLQ
jgi:hypothetical protein